MTVAQVSEHVPIVTRGHQPGTFLVRLRKLRGFEYKA